MPSTTGIPGDEKQDSDLNVGQRNTDQLVNRLSRSEQQPGSFNMDDFERNFGENADNTQEDANIEKLRQREAEGDTPAGWKTDIDTPQEKGKVKAKAKGWVKKAAPALGLGGILGIGGFVLIGLTSPSLLIVQMKEIMTEKFNTQLASMEVRSNKLLVAKIDGSTKGFCTTTVSLACKFTTMSEKQKTKLAAAGIEVEGTEAIAGRTKPTKLIFKGEEIAPQDFSRRASTDPEFRSALKQAYNPKYAGFVGNAWAKVATKFKINKQVPELDAAKDPAEAKKKINQLAKEGVEDTRSRTRLAASDKECTSNCISETDAEAANRTALEIEDGAKNGSAAADVREKLSGITAGSVGNAFKLTGAIDSGCQVYGALSTLSYAAKAIRAAQLVRYSMIFFSMADAIKGGVSPKPEDVALLGTIATSTVKDPADATKTLVGSATDSFGYKYAAYGDTSASESSMKLSNRFMAGGGLVGELSAASATALTFIPGGRQNAKNVCGTLGNPLIQGASVVLGVATLLIPGVNAAKVAASAITGVTVGIALAVLPSMLADIVAGTVTEDIVGEETGNAITSGAGSLMSDSLAAENGNAPMQKDDAVQYAMQQNNVSKQYIADELRDASPFDASNPHTFLGSITSNLLPLQSSSNVLTAVGSLLSSSVSRIIPSSSALTTEQYKASLDVCQDVDITDAGYAADPFCNVIRGIPARYLDKDPLAVIDQLVAAGDLTENGKPTGNYPDFIKKCISTSAPLGYSSADTGYSAEEAKDCIINDANSNYYLNYMDQRVNLGLSDEDTEEAAANDALESNGAYVLPTNTGYGYPDSDQDWGPRDVGTPFHRGIDITGFSGGTVGQPVYAVADGTVTRAAMGNTRCSFGENTPKEWSNVVEITHADGTISGYWHMASQDVKVKVGDTVKAGQQIGAVNSCGYAYGAHLHFTISLGSATDPAITAIEQNGEYINPVDYMRLRGIDIMRGAYTDGR